jgi:hypothetical protein
MLRTACLALWFLLSTALLAAPIEVSPPSNVETGRSPSLGQVLSYQYAPDELFDVKICREQRTTEPCVIKVKVTGFRARKVAVAVRDPHTAAVKLVGRSALDDDGKWSGQLMFTEVGAINVLFLLYDREGEVLAVEGISLNVKPPSTQLGEQDKRSIYDIGSDTDSPTGDTYYYSPLSYED